MNSPTLLLGNVILRGQRPFLWSITSGVFPHQAFWVLTNQCAKDMEAQGLGQPFNLSVDTGSVGPGLNKPAKKHLFAKLYPQEILPGPDHHHKVLLVEDLRWKWAYEHLAPQFNMIRQVGTLLPFNDSKKPELQVTDPQLIYNPATLKPFSTTNFGNTPWTSRDALEWVLTQPAPNGLDETLIVKSIGPQTPFQELPIDDRGHHTVERILNYMSGTSLFRTDMGTWFFTTPAQTRARLPRREPGLGISALLASRITSCAGRRGPLRLSPCSLSSVR